ncbi:MAG: hypothetical protein ACLFWL_04120 [Candidatus Brocadiia bacterium]
MERVNGRLDVSFGFENHYIRGNKKMRARCSLALIVMLAMALGRVRENKSKSASWEDRTAPTIRSLVGARLGRSQRRRQKVAEILLPCGKGV